MTKQINCKVVKTVPLDAGFSIGAEGGFYNLHSRPPQTKTTFPRQSFLYSERLAKTPLPINKQRNITLLDCCA
jgi:hypothetical protein